MFEHVFHEREDGWHSSKKYSRKTLTSFDPTYSVFRADSVTYYGVCAVCLRWMQLQETVSVPSLFTEPSSAYCILLMSLLLVSQPMRRQGGGTESEYKDFSNLTTCTVRVEGKSDHFDSCEKSESPFVHHKYMAFFDSHRVMYSTQAIGRACGVPLSGLWAAGVTGFRVFHLAFYRDQKRIYPRILFSNGADTD